jgi:hypothetical protein
MHRKAPAGQETFDSETFDSETGSVSVEAVRGCPVLGMISAIVCEGSASVLPGVPVLLLALLLPEPSEPGSGGRLRELAKLRY